MPRGCSSTESVSAVIPVALLYVRADRLLTQNRVHSYRVAFGFFFFIPDVHFPDALYKVVLFPVTGKLYCKLHFSQRKCAVKPGRILEPEMVNGLHVIFYNALP